MNSFPSTPNRSSGKQKNESIFSTVSSSLGVLTQILTFNTDMLKTDFNYTTSKFQHSIVTTHIRVFQRTDRQL